MARMAGCMVGDEAEVQWAVKTADSYWPAATKYCFFHWIAPFAEPIALFLIWYKKASDTVAFLVRPA
jgi:hypothetical protein